MRALIVLGFAAGCFRPDPVTGSPCSESQPCPAGLVCTFGTCQREPGPDDDSGGLCFGGFVRVCLSAPPAAAVAISADTTLDTDASPLCVASDHPELCVVVGTSVAVIGALRATGARPLVLLSASTLEIAGRVDVASHRADATVGAGGDSGECMTPAADMMSGGPGGSFGGTGGAGAGGGMGRPAGPPAGALGAARGGCAGTIGGDAGGTGGGAGHGGGAVVLIAGVLAVEGSINASGAGGSGGDTGGSGGGGGSGGLIVLDAATVQLAAAASVFANGGGGGAAGTIGIGDPGQDPSAAATPARGGIGISGAGGAGAAGAELDGSDGSDFGGGGGGGAGVIRVFGGAVAGTVSPPPS